MFNAHDRSGTISRQIYFEVLEKMSQNHPLRKISIWDHERFTSPDIDEEFRDIDLNPLLGIVYEQWCTTSSMAEFTRFWENVVQNDLGENLRDKDEVSHFLILKQSQNVIAMKQGWGWDIGLILKILIEG